VSDEPNQPTQQIDADGYHTAVLPTETLAGLGVKDGGRYIDMTMGGAGHTRMMLDAADCRVLALDRDGEAIRRAQGILTPYGDRVRVVQTAFDQVAQVAADNDFLPVNGILMDLGVSSRQLDVASRGFSFRSDGPLDMRMDAGANIPTAADLVRDLSEDELVRIFKEYGEERHARRIARAIVALRAATPITTTARLAALVEQAAPAQRGPRRIHPATRIFQALRIAVNDELGMLDRALDSAFELLADGGRFAVISFHSLEDRMVKRRMKGWTTGCVCPSSFPECRCGQVPLASRVTRKAQVAGDSERDSNRRARSARLRVIQRILPKEGENTPLSAS